LAVASGGTGVSASTGTVSVVLNTSPIITTPTLIGPALGTPTSGNLIATTNIPVANATGTLLVNNGGTGLSTLTSNSVLLGNGTSTIQFVSPGTTGNVLTSNGTTWSSVAPSGGGGGAMTLISTKNASGSSISWTGLSGYSKYQIILQNIVSTTGDFLYLQFGTGSGPTYITSFYDYQAIDTTGNVSTPYGSSGGSYFKLCFNTIAASSGFGMQGIINITAMNSGSYTAINYQTSYVYSNVSFSNGGGFVESTTAKTAIKLFMSETIAYGSASLYGISS
jgi:hypothetical protein